MNRNFAPSARRVSSVTPYTPSASTLWPCRRISVGLLPSGACDDGLEAPHGNDSVHVHAEVAEDFGVKAGVGGIRPPAGGDDSDPAPLSYARNHGFRRNAASVSSVLDLRYGSAP